MKYFLIVAMIFVIVGAGCKQQEEIPELIIGEPEPTEKVGDLTIDPIVTDQPVVVPTESKMSVLNYYYAIPQKYLPFPAQEREEGVDLVDEENYYLKFSPLTLDGDGTIAVFISGDHEYVILELKGCGPMCQQDITVLELVDDTWYDRTTTVWKDVEITVSVQEAVKQEYLSENPDADPDDVPFVRLYELPQYGTTIDVYDQFSGEYFAEISWSGGTFHPKYIEIGNRNFFDRYR
ncbi:MAG: hypothetical protein ABH846_03270 [Patescibacteria group bacterium]